MDKSVKKTSEMKIRIGLNAANVPVKIKWRSDDSNDPKSKEAKAMLLSFFDKDTLDTLKIDLWTSDLQVMEMDRFMFQTLRALTDTYYKATQNKELAVEMQKFVQYFGERTEIIKKEE